eukprot:3777002-Prymnesium_polylepis.2
MTTLCMFANGSVLKPPNCTAYHAHTVHTWYKRTDHTPTCDVSAALCVVALPPIVSLLLLLLSLSRFTLPRSIALSLSLSLSLSHSLALSRSLSLSVALSVALSLSPSLALSLSLVLWPTKYTRWALCFWRAVRRAPSAQQPAITGGRARTRPAFRRRCHAITRNNPPAP